MATLQELEAMSMDDLLNAANQDMESQVEEQPRNDKGQFASQEEEVSPAGEGAETSETPGEGETQEEVQTPAPSQTVYRRVIDLGDGAGVQVFEASTQEGLIDKLTVAQEHASRKIRELSQVKKQEKQDTADNDYILSQELLTNPTAAFRKQFESIVGMPIESFKTTVEKVRVYEAKQAGRAAAEQFVTSTPNYYDSEANGARIGRYLNRMGWEYTVENMKKAFEDLSADGLLAPRPQAPSDGSSEAPAAQPRIATPAQPATPQRKAGSNLSSRGRSVAPPAKKQTSEADMYNMDLDKLRDLANRQLKGEPVE